MRTIVRHIALGILAAGIAIQFYPQTERKNPPVTGELEPPALVREILSNSCYDCHSNETRWPWYGYVAPMSWLIAYDVQEARSQMNFSTWLKDIPLDSQHYFIDRLVERVEKGDMPPRRYLLFHPSAEVRPEELESLKRWRKDVSSTVASTPQSLP